MPSLDGLKTWFDYELLVAALVVALLVAAWVTNRIVAPLKGPPLTSPEFAIAFTAICLGAILLAIGMANRYG